MEFDSSNYLVCRHCCCRELFTLCILLLNQCVDLHQILWGYSNFDGIMGNFVYFLANSLKIFCKTTDHKSFIFGLESPQGM